jgi:hypothetical protein
LVELVVWAASILDVAVEVDVVSVIAVSGAISALRVEGIGLL